MATLKVLLALLETPLVSRNILSNTLLIPIPLPWPTWETTEAPPKGESEPLIPRNLVLTLPRQPALSRQATRQTALNITFLLPRNGAPCRRCTMKTSFTTRTSRKGTRYTSPPPPTAPSIPHSKRNAKGVVQLGIVPSLEVWYTAVAVHPVTSSS